jgi:alpha-ketoglutarate-dependent taurine dioxygenase
MSSHSPAMLDRAIEGPSAWQCRQVRPESYRVSLSPACLDEIRHAADALRAYPLPTIVLDPGEFALPQCAAAMAQVRRILDRGIRFAVLDRLLLDEIGAEAAPAIYWLLASLVARPVAQKLDGTLIYDVHDTGRQALPGSGVRPDKTNIEIRFHNDNSYNTRPPEYVALLCLRTAKRGGRSRVASFHSAHNALLAHGREHLPRLYRPFWFDRQREHFADESPIFSAPVFELAGELRTRLSAHQIHGGYALRGEPIDNEGAGALDALLSLFDEDEMSLEFDLEPGQIEFLDNRAIGHSRTEFEDHVEPERRRHLVRLWLRDRGHRAYPG